MELCGQSGGISLRARLKSLDRIDHHFPIAFCFLGVHVALDLHVLSLRFDERGEQATSFGALLTRYGTVYIILEIYKVPKRVLRSRLF